MTDCSIPDCDRHATPTVFEPSKVRIGYCARHVGRVQRRIRETGDTPAEAAAAVRRQETSSGGRVVTGP